MSETALICGVGGQDGALLARFLLGKGYAVWGTSRDAQGSSLSNLARLGIRQQVNVLSMQQEDFRSVLIALTKSGADEIYFLSGQSSVSLSFEQPAETMQSITLGTLNMLEACRMAGRSVKLYNAASSECFGDTGGEPATEQTPFRPVSPYAVAKASAYWLVNSYRQAYGLFACNGILFNHESPLRPERFVTQKIVKAAQRIAAGSSEILELGRLDIQRDWGWAPEYIEAMWLMLQQDQADDFIVASGTTSTLEDFVERSFAVFGLNWRDHVRQNQSFFRPTDIPRSSADPSKAARVLGWQARYKVGDVVAAMSNPEF